LRGLSAGHFGADDKPARVRCLAGIFMASLSATARNPVYRHAPFKAQKMFSPQPSFKLG
jgi:hypothetical protein